MPDWKECLAVLSDGTEDGVDYSPAWTPLQNYSGVDLTELEKSFMYQSESELGGIPLQGNLQYYPGGGYVARLGTTMEEASKTIDRLIENAWLDEMTAACFLEFNFYNANTGLMTAVIILIEFPVHSGALYYYDIESLVLYRYFGPSGVFALMTEIACCIFIISLVIMEIKVVVRQKLDYFKSPWNVNQFISVLLFVCAAVMYGIRSMWTANKITELMNDRGRIILS